MKSRLPLLAFAAIPFMAVTACTFFSSISPETAANNLREKEYEVTVTSGNDVDTSNPDTPLYNLSFVTDCVYGQKDSDEVYLIYFPSTDDAEDQMNFIHTKLKSGQVNEMIYVGTSQAIKDAGIKTLF
ncbi:MAG: hypothetical protein K6C32_01875 [Bacilli bacterium]|nr:hypothetical protein [Bacilli bacterium]